jgi:hypothetical protein
MEKTEQTEITVYGAHLTRSLVPKLQLGNAGTEAPASRAS